MLLLLLLASLKSAGHNEHSFIFKSLVYACVCVCVCIAMANLCAVAYAVDFHLYCAYAVWATLISFHTLSRSCVFLFFPPPLCYKGQRACLLGAHSMDGYGSSRRGTKWRGAGEEVRGGALGLSALRNMLIVPVLPVG